MLQDSEFFGEYPQLPKYRPAFSRKVSISFVKDDKIKPLESSEMGSTFQRKKYVDDFTLMQKERTLDQIGRKSSTNNIISPSLNNYGMFQQLKRKHSQAITELKSISSASSNTSQNNQEQIQTGNHLYVRLSPKFIRLQENSGNIGSHHILHDSHGDQITQGRFTFKQIQLSDENTKKHSDLLDYSQHANYDKNRQESNIDETYLENFDLRKMAKLIQQCEETSESQSYKTPEGENPENKMKTINFNQKNRESKMSFQHLNIDTLGIKGRSQDFHSFKKTNKKDDTKSQWMNYDQFESHESVYGGNSSQSQQYSSHKFINSPGQRVSGAMNYQSTLEKESSYRKKPSLLSQFAQQKEVILDEESSLEELDEVNLFQHKQYMSSFSLKRKQAYQRNVMNSHKKTRAIEPESSVRPFQDDSPFISSNLLKPMYQPVFSDIMSPSSNFDKVLKNQERQMKAMLDAHTDFMKQTIKYLKKQKEKQKVQHLERKVKSLQSKVKQLQKTKLYQ